MNLILSSNGWLNFKNFNLPICLKRILLANSGLPTSKIGSWTNRFSIFLKTFPLVFDWVISPTEFPDVKFIYARKRKYSKLGFKRFFIRNISFWIYKDYITILNNIVSKNEELYILVIDDLWLLECVSLWKRSKKNLNIRLDFSFHGHSFLLPESWGQEVNHVFFLTHIGYLETLSKNEVFTPEVSIIGNGTNSDLFYPISQSIKSERKKSLGYNDDDLILLWVSNDRPKKGLKLFLKIGEKLIEQYSNIKILLIGAPQSIKLPGDQWRNLGKIPNSSLPEFLQIGDFYFFTSLWKEGFGLSLIEAAKCGNILLASKNGGIPEVVAPLNQVILIEHPNIVEDWIKGFEEALRFKKSFKPNFDELNQYFNLNNWMSNLLKAIE